MSRSPSVTAGARSARGSDTAGDVRQAGGTAARRADASRPCAARKRSVATATQCTAEDGDGRRGQESSVSQTRRRMQAVGVTRDDSAAYPLQPAELQIALGPTCWIARRAHDVRQMSLGRL